MKENSVWQEILSESKSSRGLQSKNLIVLGDDESGKRTLFNSLKEVSATNYPLKSSLGLLNEREYFYRREIGLKK